MKSVKLITSVICAGALVGVNGNSFALTDRPIINIPSFSLPGNRDFETLWFSTTYGAAYPYMMKHIKNIDIYGCGSTSQNYLHIEFDVTGEREFFNANHVNGEHWGVALRNNVQILSGWGSVGPDGRLSTGNGIAVGSWQSNTYGPAVEWFDKYEFPQWPSSTLPIDLSTYIGTGSAYPSYLSTMASKYRYYITSYKMNPIPAGWATPNLVAFAVSKWNGSGWIGVGQIQYSFDKNPLLENGKDITFSAIFYKNGSPFQNGTTPLNFSNIKITWGC